MTRPWKAGDKVELTVPMSLTVEAMPDDPKTQAFLYGPIVLAGDLGSDGLTEQMIVGRMLHKCAACRSKSRRSGRRERTRRRGFDRRAPHLRSTLPVNRRTCSWRQSTACSGNAIRFYWQVS
ncbi:MAG: hypothetical protein WDO73_23410 [Ignavibacteriota bacterium]